MKMIWEANDIECGRFVCKPTHQFSDRKSILERQFEPDGWTSKWTHKIGWLAAGNPLDKTDYKLPPDEQENSRISTN